MCRRGARTGRLRLGDRAHGAAYCEALKAAGHQIKGQSGDAVRLTIGRILVDIMYRRPAGNLRQLERGSFPDGSMHGGNQPTDISLIHRRCNGLVPHRPITLRALQLLLY